MAVNIKTLSKISKNEGIVIHSDIDKEFEIDRDDVHIYKNYDSIVQSLWNIISTEKGEMPFLVAFGTDLRKYLFEPATSANLEKIKADFVDQVQVWEDRVDIVDAKINIYEKLGVIKIDLLFTIGEELLRETFTIGKTGQRTISERSEGVF